MPEPAEPARFLLRLRSVRRDVPAYVRLRKLLKAVLRAYGFRCEFVEELPPPERPGKSSCPGADGSS